MSTSDDNTPWNKKAKNGLKSFFSEATYCKWVGEDTHESRLLDRLKKVNVSLSTKQPCSPWFLPTPDKPMVNSKDAKLSNSAGTSTGQTIPKTAKCDKTVARTVIKTSCKEQIDILTEKLWSGVQGSDYITKQTLQTKPSDMTAHEMDTDQVGDENDEQDMCEDNAASKQITGNDLVDTKQNVDVVDERLNTVKLETYVTVSDGSKTDTKDMEEDKEINAGTVVGSDSSLIKPGFFYRDSTQVREEESESVEPLEETSTLQIASSSNVGKNQIFSAEATNEQSKADSVAMETETDPQKLGKRGYIPLDPMFYNIKDRKAEKYFPEIFKKKPRNRFSRLTSHEQKVYLELQQMYGKANPTEQDLADESYHKYLKMREVVQREQQLFQSYLRSISRICKADYQYIHTEVDKYVTAKFVRKRREVYTYPRFYNFVRKFDLSDDISDTPPTLQYIRPLLKLGHVSKLVLPSILPGLPQPCVTTNCKKIDELCPIIPKVYSGTYVWNNVVCSRDANAEQLAVPNKCDVVMSSSAIKHLVDNQGSIYKYWDMPFTVREYKIKEGDAEITHKVVYIDKPIIRRSQFVPRERIQLYQKYAIRASSIRSNQRGHMFCGIKPVHEVVSNYNVSDIAEQIQQCEESMKGTGALETESGSIENDNGSDNAQKDRRKRKRKGGEGVKKAQGGMFEAQDDIDDLETFGMDSYVTLKSKDVNGKNIDTEPEVKEPRSVKTKSREVKSAENDLEVLRKELSGIRSLAMKEAAQTIEVDTTKRGDKDKAKLEETHKPNLSLSDNNFERTNDSETLDTEGAKVDSHVTNTESKSQNVTERGVISVKNLSSLSEKMKQMSSIKSKHEKLIGNSEPSSVLVRKQNFSITTVKSVSQSTESKSIDEVVNEGTDARTEDIQKDYSTGMVHDADTGSDSDDEALVIDLPTDEDGSGKTTDSSGKTMDNSGKTMDISGQTMIKRLETKSKSHSQSEVKLDATDPSTISTFTNDVEQSAMKVESSDQISKPDALNTRRKRLNTAAKTDLDVTLPKRLLRSASNKGDSPQGTCSRVTRSCVQKSLPETSQVTAIHAEPKPVPSPAGRGRKRACTDIRVTRSRSVSTDDDHTTHSEKVSLRSSRRSLPSHVDHSGISLENKTSPSLGRSLHSNKKKKIKGKQGEEDHSVEKSEFNATAKASMRRSIEQLDETTKDMDEDLSDIKVNKAIDIQEVEASGKKAVNVMEMGNETEKDDVNKTEHSNIKKSKRTTCINENNESKKIKEMAKAMKIKLVESKGNEKLKVKVGKVFEDSKLKVKDGKIAEDLKKSSIKPVCSEMDKELNGDNRKPKALNESDMKKTEHSVATSSSLENVSKPSSNLGSGTMPGLPETKNKRTNAEMFAANHGMSHCGYPVDGNVTYHQWNLAGINVLIRCKYHGFISGQGLVHLCPKMEYQPNFGYEEDTVNDITRNWISVYTRPNSTLLKARINPYNSEIMMLEYVAYQDLIPASSEFSPAQAFTDLHVIMDKLKSLPVGEYILKNNPRKDMFSVMKATENDKRGTFDLHHQHSSYMKTEVPNCIQWAPLNTKLMLPHQRKSHLIPCTYPPKDMSPGFTNSPKRTKKKGKKGRNFKQK